MTAAASTATIVTMLDVTLSTQAAPMALALPRTGRKFLPR